MAAVAARDLGHSRVLVYQAGLPDWMARGYPVQRALTTGASH
jgi:3-mercaptopyruvate sulfurtransferase SseA